MLERLVSEGLPVENEDLSLNGWFRFSENALRSWLICSCVSGMDHKLHCSRTCIWRVKYSRASELNSGSGEVKAIYASISTVLKRFPALVDLPGGPSCRSVLHRR